MSKMRSRKSSYFGQMECKSVLLEYMYLFIDFRIGSGGLLVSLTPWKNCTDRLLIRKALETLPKTLDETYARILRTIPGEYQANSTRILQLLSYSSRPLEMLEVVDALAVDLESTPAFSVANRMPKPEELIVFCSSLVTSNKETGKLQLAHFSVRQYLFTDRIEPP